jgi:hypothetical protein
LFSIIAKPYKDSSSQQAFLYISEKVQYCGTGVARSGVILLPEPEPEAASKVYNLKLEKKPKNRVGSGAGERN